MQNFARLCKI